MKKHIILSFFIFSSIFVFGQKNKMTTAYIFEDYIFENYEGVKKLNAQIEKMQEEFQTEFNKRALEYQNANLEYQNSLKNIANEDSESINAKLKRVQGIKEDTEEYQRESEKKLQEFVGLNLIKTKDEIKTATQEVAGSKDIVYVFTRNRSDSPMTFDRVVLFADNNKTLNISDDVIKHLNSKLK